MSRLRVLLWLSLATLCAPSFGANPAGPGTVNYIEGSANLAGQPLTPRSVGSTTMEAGQSLTTGQGKAEVLLTPGVFLRLDDNSAVRMVSPDLTYTVFDLERGRAMVEADNIYPQNDVQIVDHGIHSELLKNGLYEFNANNGETMVFDGKEAVRKSENRWVVVKGKHELALATGELGKPHKFDISAHEDELYNWSSLRSEYLSEANSQLAGEYAGVPAFTAGWFWDPYMWDYTFIGAGPFWSPFGWGFYPPWYFGYGGVFYGRRGFAGRGYARGGFHSMGGGFHGGGGFGGSGRR